MTPVTLVGQRQKQPLCSRAGIYYWKCDRPAGLHNVEGATASDRVGIPRHLEDVLRGAFPTLTGLRPAGGKGNHRTFFLEAGATVYFVRVEDGPEGDAHMDVESLVITEVAKAGVPVPRVYFSDGSRQQVPFAVQVIEYFDCPDLNLLYREGRLSLIETAASIGKAIAGWQKVSVAGFGPFDPEAATGGLLQGYHRSYAFYFRLHLDRHLTLLVAEKLISDDEAVSIRRLIEEKAELLNIETGCLVHKDLAFWNIMGTPERIRAFIDWDDAIAGDPTDDLSLLACFHPHLVVQAAISGYESVRPLPERFIERFWLHLLRNMIVKAVIRCGAGYFREAAGGAFLMAPGQSGERFRAFTRDRLLTAVRGLKGEGVLTDL